jgi:predicted nuclease with TOPRIM domain
MDQKLFPKVRPHACDSSLAELSTQCVRQWLNNKMRTPGGRLVQKIQSQRGKTTARHLVMQKYAKHLGQQCKDILLERPELDSLTAYNRALNEKIEELKDDNPEEWQQLEKKAEELRSANQSDYTDLSSEALERQGFLSITRKRKIPDQVAFSRLNSFLSTP